MGSAAGVALVPLARTGVVRGAHFALRGCDVAALVVAISSVLSCAAATSPAPTHVAFSCQSCRNSHLAASSLLAPRIAANRRTLVTHSPSTTAQCRLVHAPPRHWWSKGAEAEVAEAREGWRLLRAALTPARKP